MEETGLRDFFVGKRVTLTLGDSSYAGTVKRINPSKSLILTDVTCSDGCRRPGSKLFFGPDILNDADDEKEKIKFVVVDNFHENFGPAVMDIKRQHAIGVGADGVDAFKHGRLCWLQIATKNKVYLFDILLLGDRAFKNGLSMIFENKHILKIIHDCRFIAGYLISQHGTNIANIFDTQVADVMRFFSETGGFLPNRVSTLEEVVSLHLKVPSSQLTYYQMKSKLVQEDWRVWQKRPCTAPLLKLMALSVIHLLPLRLVLVDSLMMDYVSLVDSYLNSGYFEPDELHHTRTGSVLELPSEFRKLEQMCRERQKWARGHYPVTAQGLLARFDPRIPSPEQASPVEEQRRRLKAESGTMESPSSTKVDPPLLNPLPIPSKVNGGPSVVVHASPDEKAQASVPATVPKPTADTTGVRGAPGLGRGSAQVLMDMRSRMLPPKALPATGRGFLLQVSKAKEPGESRGERSSFW
ncbi:piRNA biogenesis protein EXD1 [Brachionichthys hirsutus]|uniref:piRNA biogenesis protein EXD1 n=1 Tax=Brachionichthys hirsutus TaxID=412623 RepID=UPI00360513EF